MVDDDADDDDDDDVDGDVDGEEEEEEVEGVVEEEEEDDHHVDDDSFHFLFAQKALPPDISREAFSDYTIYKSTPPLSLCPFPVFSFSS